MAIVKRKTSNVWAVSCDCCGRETFYEASREDAVAAVRNSSWCIVNCGGCPPRDYCPGCFETAHAALESRHKMYGGRK